MTELSYRFFSPDQPVEAKNLQEGLDAYATETADIQRRPVGLYVYQDGKCVGGINGIVTPERLSVKLLWIKDEFRGQGIGRQLMQNLEEQAVLQGVKKVFVDTLSYQAPNFYQRMGYNETARISQFYKGHDRIFYQKSLA